MPIQCSKSEQTISKKKKKKKKTQTKVNLFSILMV